jgi:hypothetical protein
MKKLNILFAIIICVLNLTLNAQEQTKSQEKQIEGDQETIAIFDIIDARDNGYDISPVAIENEAYLALYTTSNNLDEILLTNFWKKNNSQSFGSIYGITKKEFPESDKYYRGELYSFYWSYSNSYDNNLGTAKIKLNLFYKPQGIYYELTIVPENLDVLIYKGEMHGDLTLLDNHLKNKKQ